MPPSTRVRYTCSACGASFPKWEGRCNECGEWNSLVEELERAVGPRTRRGTISVEPTTLNAITATGADRFSGGIAEFDRVLGGGFVPGGLVLLGGDPGIGKSTLALQLARSSGKEQSPALYCAGEESATQLALRARRIGCDVASVAVVAETDLDAIIGTIEAQKPPLAVVDSVQTLYDAAVPGVPGSPSQVREAVARLLACAKRSGVAILLIGHVTKEGAIAGPRTLEHMVDVVLYLEGERHGDYRLLRGIKNRFGPTGELGIFAMREEGMIEVGAPGRSFFEEASLGVAGNVLTVICEGSRALAVEIQALTVPTPFGLPRRTASGFDLGRLHLLLAVLEKRAKLALGQSDVYVNVVGGVRVADPAVDLAVAMAVAGSLREKTVPPGCIVVGELGLGGEVRRVRRLDMRLAEASALGITTAVIPTIHKEKLPDISYVRVATLAEALGVLR